MKELSLNIPSPIEQLTGFSDFCNVYIKREELIHSDFGGNKWRKLKYNIKEYYEKGYGVMITFGGPFSNHIAATAAVCAVYDIPSVGIIRGTYNDPNNPTLIEAKKRGMQLHHVPKDAYRLKTDSVIISDIIQSYDKPLVIPEGGNNVEGMYGMKDLASEIENYNIDFDVIGVAAGTGATSAGIIKYSESHAVIKVINVLRNKSLAGYIGTQVDRTSNDWQVIGDYHFGGYAKTTQELQSYALQFADTYNVHLDPVYNSKLFYAMHDMMSQRMINEGSDVLIINTGGYQGIEAYNYVNEKPWIR